MIAPNKPEPNANMRAFLAAYRKTGCITSAAKAAKVERVKHYHWLKSNPNYAELFEQAREEVADRLEREATFRAIKGMRKYKFNNGSRVMIPCEANHPDAEAVQFKGETRYVRHYYEYDRSDTLLIFLLKAARPEKYRENVKVEQEVDFRGELTVTQDEDWYGNRSRIDSETA